MTFKVGDRIRNVRDYDSCIPRGFETIVLGFTGPQITIKDQDGDVRRRWPHDYELVQPAGPVRTETVTRSVIVPGVYGRVGVGVVGPFSFVDPTRPWTADELDAAALVLTQLAAAVRDAN